MDDSVCIWEVHTPVPHTIGNGKGRRTAAMAGPLLLTSDPVRYEAMLHSCGKSPVGGMAPTYESLLPHQNLRLPAP